MEDVFLERLKEEAPQWQQDGLISEGQCHSILARYGLVEGELEYRTNRVVSTLAVLGALLLGIGVILFFAANWQYLPLGTKVFLLVASVVGAYAAGYWLRFERERLPQVGSALIFLGALLYGAAIFLIAQGFHVRAHEANLVYLWAVGILPMAYLIRSRAMLVVALLAISIGIGWDLSRFGLHFFQSVTLYLVLGVLLYSLGEIHRDHDWGTDLHAPFTQFGLFITLGVLYLLSFRWVWGSTGSPEEAFTLMSPGGVRYAILAVAATAATVTQWLLSKRENRKVEMLEGGALLLLVALGCGIAFLGGRGHGSPDEGYPVEAILFNLLLFALTIGVIADGYYQRRPTLVNLGIFFFGAHLLTRYFDIFGRFLDTAAVFVGAGLLLLVGGAFLERTRRRLVKRITEPS
jgi:uncharacterized membrane protein